MIPLSANRAQMPNGFFDFILAAMEDEFIILIEGIESRVWSPLGIPAQLEIGSEMMTDAIQETRLGVLRVFIQLEVMGRLENAEHRAVIDQDRDDREAAVISHIHFVAAPIRFAIVLTANCNQDSTFIQADP